MSFSPNIQVSSDFKDSEKVNVHNKNLEIATLNLDNYNSKLDNHVCKLLYNIETFEFEIIDKHDSHSEFINSEINHFCWWKEQDDIQAYVKDYTFSVENLHFKRVYEIVSMDISVNRPIDSEYFIEEKKLFFLRFKDSYPLGFLSVEQQSEIKTKLNELCSTLENLVKYKFQN